MSRFAPVPEPERRAEVLDSLRSKLDRVEQAARAWVAADNEPERLAERLREHGWEVIAPASASNADVCSIRRDSA